MRRSLALAATFLALGVAPAAATAHRLLRPRALSAGIQRLGRRGASARSRAR